MTSVLIGVALGLVLSLFGAGGGALAVPALLELGLSVPEATATSLAIVFAGALIATAGHAVNQRVRSREGLLVGVPAIAGASVGGLLHRLVPERLTLALFILLLVLAITAFVRQRPVDGAPRARPAGLALCGLGVGVLTGFLGIGGGFLFVPALARFGGLAPHLAVGTSALIISMASASGAIAAVAQGRVAGTFALPLALGAILGAAAGIPISRRLPAKLIRWGFALLASVVAVTLLVRLVSST